VRGRRCGRCVHAGGGDSGTSWRRRAVLSAAAAAHWPLRRCSVPSAPPGRRHSDASRRSRGDHGRPAAASVCPPRQIPGRHRCSLCPSAREGRVGEDEKCAGTVNVAAMESAEGPTGPHTERRRQSSNIKASVACSYPAGEMEAWRQLGRLFTLYLACQVCRRRWWPASSISAHAAAAVRS